MKKKPQKKSQKSSPKKTKNRSGEQHTWVIGLTSGGVRARSYAVAHAKIGTKLVCGRSRTVRWAGYKKKRIASFEPAALYERRCKRCLVVLFPIRPRSKR